MVCVTTAGAKYHWTCFADMNREVSHESRGGGAMCKENQAVWKTFNNVVGRQESFLYKSCMSISPVLCH